MKVYAFIDSQNLNLGVKSQYNKAIIVSGDGDFFCLAEYLAKKKKLGKIIVPNKKYSSLLKKFSPYIVNIDLFRLKLKK